MRRQQRTGHQQGLARGRYTETFHCHRPEHRQIAVLVQHRLRQHTVVLQRAGGLAAQMLEKCSRHGEIVIQKRHIRRANPGTVTGLGMLRRLVSGYTAEQDTVRLQELHHAMEN